MFDKFSWMLIIAGFISAFFAVMAIIDGDIKFTFIFIIIMFIIAFIAKSHDNYRNTGS